MRKKAYLLLTTFVISVILFSFSEKMIYTITPQLFLFPLGCIGFRILTTYKKSSFVLSSSELISLLWLILLWVRMSFLELFTPLWTTTALSCWLLYSKCRQIDFNDRYAGVIILLLGVGQACLGLGQYFHLWNGVSSDFPITGSFDNPIGYSASLVVAYPFGFQLFRLEKGRRRSLIIAGLIIIITGIILSKSRSGYAALLGVSVWFDYGLLKHTVKRMYNWINSKYISLSWCLIIIVGLIIVWGLYVFKQDSADGRILIWRCSIDLFMDHFLLGNGVGGFAQDYMEVQSVYFHNNPDSSFAHLADNVNHPFNEYLLVAVEQGVWGLSFCFILIYRLIKVTRLQACDHWMGVIIGVAIMSLFSYPLRYPIILFVLVLSLGRLMNHELPLITILFTKKIRFMHYIIIVLLSLLSAIMVIQFVYEYKWSKLARQNHYNLTSFPEKSYKKLYPLMRYNAYFLSNYASMLNANERWEESNLLINQCLLLLDDADVQMLKADNYMRLKQNSESEQALHLAHNMVPSRFTPLYQLMKLYKSEGEDSKAQDIAHKIVSKEIKVPSKEVDLIIREANYLIKESK